MDREVLKRVVREFGPAVIEYACNLTEEDVHALVSGTLQLDGPQQQVLEEFSTEMETIRVQAAVQGLPAHTYLQVALDQAALAARLTTYRQAAGGSVEEITETEDPVLAPLIAMAQMIYPLQLVSSTDVVFGRMIRWMGAVRLTFNAPLQQQFQDAVLADPDLGRLFPTRSESRIEIAGYIYSSLGHGGGMQLVLLMGNFLQAADLLMRLSEGRSLATFVDALRRVVEMARSAAAGKRTKVPAFVGFRNIALDQAGTIELPWGTIWPYDRRWHALVPAEATPASLGAERTILGFVLGTTHDFEISLAENGPDTSDPLTEVVLPWPKSMASSVAELERKAEKTCLTFSLAIERKQPVGCARAWTLIFDPLGFSTSPSWGLGLSSPVAHYQVTPRDVPAIEEWAKTVEGLSHSSIRIAERRLISALTVRTDPIDGFVDAVIAWENLFASGGELGFRISTAMASLLKTETDDRLKLQKRVSDIYGTRSGVVHGDKSLNDAEARQLRDEAVELTVQVMRRLFRDYPEWVGMKGLAQRIVLAL